MKGAAASLSSDTRASDPEGLERVYASHAGRLKSVAYNLLGNASDAEDAVQEAFLKAHRAGEGFRHGAALSTWIYRILTNTCLDALRRRRSRPEDPVAESPEPVSRGPGDEVLRVFLEDSMTRLPDLQRAAFLLVQVEGLAHAEAARALGVSEGASRKLLFDARRALQRMLLSTRTGVSS